MDNHAVKITDVMRQEIKRFWLILLFPNLIKKLRFMIAYTELLEKDKNDLVYYIDRVETNAKQIEE